MRLMRLQEHLASRQAELEQPTDKNHTAGVRTWFDAQGRKTA